MSTHRDPTIYAASYILFVRRGKIYLQRRKNTGWQDGKYDLPAGHIESDEAPITAAIREAKEEAGVDLKPENLEFIHIMYRKSQDRTYADFYFLAKTYKGKPRIAEPEKCDADGWFSFNNLPDIIPFLKSFITDYRKGKMFSEFRG